MGIERMHTPKYWEMRAEEFRAKADNAEHRQVKDSLRKVAQNYDELAKRARQIRTVQDRFPNLS
jgi:thymidylate kinase